ncbi:MAG: rod shape-determining protein RodA [Myxococcales bacterium]|nr:rod shape-determining protein RodA [Myxococcales bacterium]
MLSLLATAGVLTLYSVAGGNWQPWALQHAMRFTVSLGLLIVFGLISMRYWMALAYPIYFVALIALALVPIIGEVNMGAQRWIDVGHFQFQPSELMKVLLVMVLARYLHDLPRERKGRPLDMLAPFAFIGLPVAFIIVQPDLSTSIICILIGTSVIALTRLSLRTILTLLSVGLVLFTLGWVSFMRDYQRSRIDVWLNPEAYADDEGYQTIQAITSVGNGGFFGRGAGQGTQNKLGFLPYGETDFPFAVFAEEWGFAGCALGLSLFLCLILWSLNVASRARDRFAALLAVGVAALFFWHVIINIGMVLQLLPVTGVTLPFFSVGGSNALTLMIGIGLLISVSRERKR